MPEALLIANANYRDKTLQALRGTAVDVNALKAVLADPAIGGYQVRTALDEPVHVLRQHIERFFAQAPKDGLLLLYLTGHGIKDRDGRLYFAAADTETDLLMSTGLAATFIQEASERSRCRRQVFIFDACFSGAFARGYSHKSGQQVHAQEPFSGGTGKIIITASDDMQYALVDDSIEGDAAASVFTRHLVEGLRTGAAANDAEAITADHLYQYVYERLREDNAAQKPQLWSFGLSGDLVLARNPAPKLKPSKLSADIVELLEDPKPRVRLLGLDELEKHLAEPGLRLALDAALATLVDDDSKAVSARAADMLARLEALRAEEQKRQAEAEAKRQAEEERKRQAEAEAKRQVEEERKRQAEAEAKRQAEEERKRQAEAEAKRQAEEERKRQAEAEAKRQAEAEAKRQAAAEAKRQAEEERKRQAEAEAKRQAEEERKHQAKAETKRQVDEETQQPVEEKQKRSSRKAAITAVGEVLLLSFLIFLIYREPQNQRMYPAEPQTQPIASPPPEIEMVSIPAGQFWMGSKDGDKQASDAEKPRHKVKIQSFKLGKTEVTQGQWKAVMGSNPSGFGTCGDDCPVERVSFNDIQDFIRKLNAKTGKTYRLPTEAEWEYACRAGGDFQYCGGNDADTVAWHGNEKADKTPHPVGRKQANAWGLYDMSGNVWEWTQDCWHSSYQGAPSNGSAWVDDTNCSRVLRGGSWGSSSDFAHAAYRGVGSPGSRLNFFGFRVVFVDPH